MWQVYKDEALNVIDQRYWRDQKEAERLVAIKNSACVSKFLSDKEHDERAERVSEQR